MPSRERAHSGPLSRGTSERESETTCRSWSRFAEDPSSDEAHLQVVLYGGSSNGITRSCSIFSGLGLRRHGRGEIWNRGPIPCGGFGSRMGTVQKRMRGALRTSLYPYGQMVDIDLQEAVATKILVRLAAGCAVFRVEHLGPRT
jgi:hypothetical protein